MCKHVFDANLVAVIKLVMLNNFAIQSIFKKCVNIYAYTHTKGMKWNKIVWEYGNTFAKKY